MQNEQQQVYTLARIENQIVDDLRDRLNELKSGRDDDIQVETHLRYFENLKKTADENIRMLDDWPGTITLRQTIDELLDMGIVKNKMPDTMREYVAAQKALEDASRTRKRHRVASERYWKRSLAVLINKCRCLINEWNKLFTLAVG